MRPRAVAAVLLGLLVPLPAPALAQGPAEVPPPLRWPGRDIRDGDVYVYRDAVSGIDTRIDIARIDGPVIVGVARMSKDGALAGHAFILAAADPTLPDITSGTWDKSGAPLDGVVQAVFVDQGPPLFPLAPGKFSWVKFRTVTNGEPEGPIRMQYCRVLGREAIEVPAGRFDAFHVGCEDGLASRELWISAQAPVTLLRQTSIRHPHGNEAPIEREDFALIRVERAGTPP